MDTDPVVSIIEALAHADGVEPEDLSYHLHDYVDLDALSALANKEQAEWELTFQVPDHEVRVTSEGAVFVDGDRFEANVQSSSRDQ